MLRISFLCNSGNLPLKSLKIVNVENLEIIQSVLTHNPLSIRFENIRRIITVPKNTFSQIKHETYRPNCFVPVNDLQEIIFDDVNIDLIATESFRNLTDIENFVWNNITVERIQTNGMQLQTKEKSGILMSNNKLILLEHLAIRLKTNKLSIVNTTLGYLHGSAINGTMDSFIFSFNNVTTMEANSLHILSYDVKLLNNYFYYLHSNALQRISPGLLMFDFDRNFATINFSYEFCYNVIYYADVGGIHPDYAAYKNVASNLTFKYNELLNCNCKKFGWLIENMEYQHGFQYVKNFYNYILNSNNSIYCKFQQCRILAKIVQKDVCENDFNMIKWCENHELASSVIRNNCAMTLYHLFQNVNILLGMLLIVNL